MDTVKKIVGVLILFVLAITLWNITDRNDLNAPSSAMTLYWEGKSYAVEADAAENFQNALENVLDDKKDPCKCVWSLQYFHDKNENRLEVVYPEHSPFTHVIIPLSGNYFDQTPLVVTGREQALGGKMTSHSSLENIKALAEDYAKTVE